MTTGTSYVDVRSVPTDIFIYHKYLCSPTSFLDTAPSVTFLRGLWHFAKS